MHINIFIIMANVYEVAVIIDGIVVSVGTIMDAFELYLCGIDHTTILVPEGASREDAQKMI